MPIFQQASASLASANNACPTPSVAKTTLSPDAPKAVAQTVPTLDTLFPEGKSGRAGLVLSFISSMEQVCV